MPISTDGSVICRVGIAQKIGLIQALFHDPELLILDAPTTALDPLLQEELPAVIGEYRERGGTVFLSSHDLDEVDASATGSRSSEDAAGSGASGAIVVTYVITSAEVKALTDHWWTSPTRSPWSSTSTQPTAPRPRSWSAPTGSWAPTCSAAPVGCSPLGRRVPRPRLDPKKIEAETHDGVVEVTIPLPKEAKKETVAITPTAA